MRGEPDHGDDLDDVSRSSLHSNDSSYSHHHHHLHHHNGGGSGGLFRKSPVTVRTQTPPGRSESPGCYPPSASPPPSSPATTTTSTSSNNPTPLLKATLNAPVAAYYSSYRNKTEVSVGSGVSGAQASSISILATKHKPDDFSNGLSNVQSSFYSSLVQQLRSKTGAGEPAVKTLLSVSTTRNNKKDKGKSLPFVCQVCNKRFQRHIALNAHFQNEHITTGNSSGGGERSCKLCGATAAGLSGIRLHLRSVHNIDLDNPMKCVDEVKVGGVTLISKSSSSSSSSASSPTLLEVSSRPGGQPEETEPSCSNIEMYESEHSSSPTASISPSPARTPSSSASPERSLYPVKQECAGSGHQDEDPQVEDLRIRKPSPVLSRRCSPAPGGGSPSPTPPLAKRYRLDQDEYPSGHQVHHQLQVQQQQDSGLNLTGGGSNEVKSTGCSSASSTTCAFCNIVYPNQTLYFLHRGFHSESNPWRCNSCGHISSDLYDFNTHLFSASHK